jgi:hypothetical protein
MQGRSFVSLLQGRQPDDWRSSMYYRYYYSHFETEPHWGVRTYDHKLIYFNRMDHWELYDLNKDPVEMNNVYDDPQYQQLAEDLKKELNRLQSELGDDPNDIGKNPNIGPLAPAPLHVSAKVDFGKGDMSILFRFKTKTGGTLFSQSNLDGAEWPKQGQKILFIRDAGLFFVEGDDDPDDTKIGVDLADGQWHTVALVIKNKRPAIYIDGELSWQGKNPVQPDKDDHNFNIGAGFDDNGYMGYNFKGIMSHVLVYEQTLDESAILKFSSGNVPSGNLIKKWLN